MYRIRLLASLWKRGGRAAPSSETVSTRVRGLLPTYLRLIAPPCLSSPLNSAMTSFAICLCTQLGSVVGFVSFLSSLPLHLSPPFHWWREIFLQSLTREIFACSHASVWGRTMGFLPVASLLCFFINTSGLFGICVSLLQKKEGLLSSSSRAVCRGHCQEGRQQYSDSHQT